MVKNSNIEKENAKTCLQCLKYGDPLGLPLSSNCKHAWNLGGQAFERERKIVGVRKR
jgi:hypothetical protein